MAGSSIMVSDSCQAYGIEGSSANPAASKYESAIFPWSSCFCHASRSRFPLAKATGSLRLLNDVRTRFHRRRALGARPLRDEILRRLAVFWGNRSTTCLRERGSSLLYAMASVCSSGVSLGGLPLRGLSWRLAGPSCSHFLIHVATVSRST